MLQKQIWINQIKKNFYPDSSFLNAVSNLNNLVDNDKINMVEAGMDPDVLINNTTYPIKVEQRVDKPITIELDLFETTNTLVRRPEVIEYSYDQLESVIKGHREMLRVSTAKKAAHAYAPAKDTDYTPVIGTSGNTDGNRKRLSFVDIVALKSRFDAADMPLEKRYLVLNPLHATDLLLEDIKLFKNLTDTKEGNVFNFAGFNILQFSKTPSYELKNGVWSKCAFGSVNSDSFCSFAFLADEVMKADGGIHMYSKENDPEQRGAIVGFDKRFIALPFRNKGIGAIVSATAVV